MSPSLLFSAVAEEVRDANRKRRAAHKHAKHLKQLEHMRLNRSKELLKISKELGELNRELNDEAGPLIKALTSQEQILEIYCLEISQSQSLSKDLKRKRAVGKQGGSSQWESWLVLLVCELLIIGITPTAIPSSIYTLYEMLTDVEPTEVPFVSFIRLCRTVVQVVGETIATWKLAVADYWRQIFTDATSRRQCEFQALVVGLMDEDGFMDLVIFSSCIFLENETSQTTFDTILDKVSIFLMFVFHFHKHLLPASFLSLISSFQNTAKLS